MLIFSLAPTKVMEWDILSVRPDDALNDHRLQVFVDGVDPNLGIHFVNSGWGQRLDVLGLKSLEAFFRYRYKKSVKKFKVLIK